MKKKDYTVTIIVVVGLFLLIMVLVADTLPKNRMTKPIVTVSHRVMGTAPIAYNGRAHIFVLDQKVGSHVVVLSAALKENGYMVIEKGVGSKGKIIGVSKLLTPALYSNSALTVTESVASGDQLVAKLYKDNGDGVFSDTTDTAVVGDGASMGFVAM